MVFDDGQLPRTICPGCSIQVEATVEFFNLIKKGQDTLRSLLEREIKYKKHISMPETDVIAEKIIYEINTSDGVYHVEHPISLQMAGQDKPKRKRGRPSKKLKTPEELACEAAALAAAQEQEARHRAERAQSPSSGKRRRKTPPRLKEAVQGRELEKIFLEEGVIDKAETDPEPISAGDGAPRSEPDVRTIGHVAGSGEPVLMRAKGRGRPRGAAGRRGQGSRCARCGLTFSTLGRYMSHVATHSRPQERNDSEQAIGTLEHEAEQVEEADTPLEPASQTASDREEAKGAGRQQCPHCPKTFASKQSKSMHVKAVHRGERPYRCDECGQLFAYPRSLALHALAHRRRRSRATGYACDVCHKVLSHPSSVTYHKQTVHAAQRFVCLDCGKAFRHRQLLQRHQLVHSAERPFRCEVCRASFKTKANLRNHSLLHSGVKRFACGVCAQRFAHKTSLTLHMRWHSGAKPFACAVCGKRFTQKGNLAEHERVHTGEKPFACGHCARRFTTSSQRRLHQRRQHTAPEAEPEPQLEVQPALDEAYDALDVVGARSPLQFRLQDGSVLTVASLDGETLQIVTQDGHSLPVEMRRCDDLEGPEGEPYFFGSGVVADLV